MTTSSSRAEPPAPGLLALVDESVREDLYLLAFCLIPADRLEEIRAALRAVPRHARPRFHWRDEQHKDRLTMMDALAALPIACTVVYQARTNPRKQEQARSRCLTVGLYELAVAGATELMLESRQRTLNLEDERTIASARRDGLVSASMPFEFARPLDEPLLWLPDAVVGATGMQLAGRTSTYVDRLPVGSWVLREVPPA